MTGDGFDRCTPNGEQIDESDRFEALARRLVKGQWWVLAAVAVVMVIVIGYFRFTSGS